MEKRLCGCYPASSTLTVSVSSLSSFGSLWELLSLPSAKSPERNQPDNQLSNENNSAQMLVVVSSGTEPRSSLLLGFLLLAGCYSSGFKVSVFSPNHPVKIQQVGMEVPHFRITEVTLVVMLVTAASCLQLPRQWFVLNRAGL